MCNHQAWGVTRRLLDNNENLVNTKQCKEPFIQFHENKKYESSINKRRIDTG